MKTDLAEKELENAQLRAALKDEFNKLPENQKNKINEETERLQKLIQIGDMFDFEVKRNSHPRREMAFRLGIALPDNQTRVPMRVLQHEDKNNYSFELINYKVETVASIGHDPRKAFYVKILETSFPIGLLR